MLSDTITNDDKKKETDHPKVSITTFEWWSASFFKESTNNMYQMFVFLDTSKQSLERRFLATDTLQTVLDYLTIEGFHHEEYKVLSSWPRRDVSIFSCLDHTFPVHLFYQLYMQETGNLNITGLVQ